MFDVSLQEGCHIITLSNDKQTDSESVSLRSIMETSAKLCDIQNPGFSLI